MSEDRACVWTERVVGRTGNACPLRIRLARVQSILDWRGYQD
jgi:hypothetical protein